MQRLHGHLVAKSIKGDEAGGRIVEADLTGFGDAEVWCGEAVFGTENIPGIAEALRVLSIEPTAARGSSRNGELV
jgi:hypothetical protein